LETLGHHDGGGSASGGSSGSDNDSLTIDTRYYLQPGQSTPIRVYYQPDNLSSTEVTMDSNTTISVESVVINNSSVLALNKTPDPWELEATNNSSVAERLNVTAEYDTGNGTVNATKEVTVAAATVENLKILPDSLIRLQALFGAGQTGFADSTMLAILIAALLAVPASRFTNAFAGLATAEVVIVIGWLGGYVGLGIAMLSIFVAMFIGLNLAANIDYAISRGGTR